MWSDHASPQRLHELTAELRALILIPSFERREIALAELEALQLQPGFMWLNGTDTPWVVHHPLATISYTNGVATVVARESTVLLRAAAFDILQAVHDAWGSGVLAGYLGYDLAAELEDLGTPPADDLDVPQMFFGLYDAVYAVQPGPLPERTVAGGTLVSRPDQATFEASVQRIVSTIHAGDIFQTNLVRRLEGDFNTSHAWPLFQRLCTINPARFAAFLRVDEARTIMSISPELFLKVDGGMVTSSPIKGTRPRGDTDAADVVLAVELLASEKDRAELAMIVDVVRNDLGRVSETGSVQVTAHAELMELPTVHHLFSTVTGKLPAEASPVDLLRATFPPASISGAPKIEAMRVAQREEGQRRGPAMGAIGWFTKDAIAGDQMEFSVAIRTAFTNGEKIFYYAGCGITADSDPATEFLESAHKSAAFERALTCDVPNE